MHEILMGERGRMEGFVQIGQPLPNVELSVLDEAGRPITPGQEGEIHIGGLCVADGYIGQDTVAHLGFYAGKAGEGGCPSRWYRTGDLAGIGADGGIFVHGRLDDQVKIAGQRFCLGEIEEAACRIPGVNAAGAALGKAQQVILYFVAAEGCPIRPQSLRQILSQTLPQVALPSKIRRIESLPLTANGKLDRKELLRWEEKENRKQAERLVLLAPDRQYFVERDRLGNTAPEHPQVSLILPALLASEDVRSAVYALIRQNNELLWGSEIMESKGLIGTEHRRDIEDAVLELPRCVSTEKGLRRVAERATRLELRYDSWPRFRIVFTEFQEHGCVLCLRCHHALGGGTRVLALMAQMLKLIGLEKPNESMPPFVTEEPDTEICVEQSGLRASSHRVFGEVRGWVETSEEVCRRLRRRARSQGLPFSRWLLGLHCRICRSLVPDAGWLQMPVFRTGVASDSSVTRSAERGEQLESVLNTYRLPPDTVPELIFEWAKSLPKPESCGSMAKSTRWNLIPVDPFLGEAGNALSLLPLDLYVSLPHLAASMPLSVLAQTWRGGLGFLIRAVTPSSVEAYMNELVRAMTPP